MIKVGTEINYSLMKAGRRYDALGRRVVISVCAKCGRKGRQDAPLKRRDGTEAPMWTHLGVFEGFFFSVKEHCIGKAA